MSNHLTDNQKLFVMFLACSIVPISGVSIDIALPSLPDMQSAFMTDKKSIQWMVSVYVLGYGIFQLFAGPHSDRYGRRLPILLSLFVYALTTIAITLTHQLSALLFLRFIQGAAVAYTLVPARAIVSDLYQGNKLQRFINYLTMAWALGPIVAPFIGGYLQHHFHWQMSFYVMTLYAVSLMILTYFFVPETHQQQTTRFSLFDSYKPLLLDSQFIILAICMGSAYSLLLSVVFTLPFYIQVQLQLSSIVTGNLALLLGIAWFLGNTANRVLDFIEIRARINMCFAAVAFSALIMALLAISHGLTVWTLITPLISVLFFGGMIFPSLFGYTLNTYREHAGAANAALGACVMFIGSSLSVLCSLLKAHTQLPLALTFMLMSLMALVLFVWTTKYQEKSHLIEQPISS